MGRTPGREEDAIRDDQAEPVVADDDMPGTARRLSARETPSTMFPVTVTESAWMSMPRTAFST